MMIVDLDRLGDSSKSFEFSVPAGELDLDTENVRLKGDTVASGEVKKSIAKIDVSGKITVPAEIDCTRCLTPIEKVLSFNFDVSFVPLEDVVKEGDVELGMSDLDVDAITSDELDLKEVVREQILLNLPEQEFCTEDCKGLCQKCGSNLNLIDCKCEETEIDPRWAALKNLK
jgi:uncharacterized protein